MPVTSTEFRPFATWTGISEYIIDFKRGLVTHSKLFGTEFRQRYQEGKEVRMRADMSPNQALYYFNNYILGELYIRFLQIENQKEQAKLAFQATRSYCWNHRAYTRKQHWHLYYPLAQTYNGSGYVREPIDMEKIYARVLNTKIENENIGTGRGPYTPQHIQAIAKDMKDYVLAPKLPQSQAIDDDE